MSDDTLQSPTTEPLDEAGGSDRRPCQDEAQTRQHGRATAGRLPPDRTTSVVGTATHGHFERGPSTVAISYVLVHKAKIIITLDISQKRLR